MDSSFFHNASLYWVVVVRLLIVGTILRCLLMFPISFNSDSCNPFYISSYCFVVILLPIHWTVLNCPFALVSNL